MSSDEQVGDSLRYVPQRSVNSVYIQRRVGPTPFSSALRPEPTDSALGSGVGGASSTPVSALAADQTHEKMTFRMNYPLCVVRGGPIYPQDTLRCVPPARSAADANAIDSRSQPMQVRPGVLSGPKPNPHWQKAPPADPVAEARAARALGLPNLKNPLPRDTLHPLISPLQADANRVARELHPEAGLLSNARRDDVPCGAHQWAAGHAGATGMPGSEQQVALGIPLRSGGGAGSMRGGNNNASSMAAGLALDGDDEDAHSGGGLGVLSGGGRGGYARRRRPHDQRSPLGRAFAAEGGMHDASEYSDNVQHFAQTMPKSLTSIAAKALAAALHDNKGGVVSTVPALAGKGNAVSMPPSPAFRNMNPAARAVLSNRARDTRHLLERVICETVPLSAPPPNALTQAVRDAVLHSGSDHELQQKRDRDDADEERNGVTKLRPNPSVRADEVEMGEMLRVPFDCSPLFCAGGGLHAWDLATAALRGAALSDGLPAATANSTAAQVAGGRAKIKSVTTQTASLFSSATQRPKLVQYLTEVGIRTADSLYQILAPSQSEFTRRPERAGQLRQFGNANETPGNAYGFDSGRFAVLLESCGFDVEEASLAGATFLDAGTIRLFGQHSPFLRLFDVSGCVHLDGKDIAAALTRSRQSLRLLNVSHIDNINGAGLDEVLPSLSNLLALCMSGLNRLSPADDYAFQHIASMRALRVLDVSYCSNIADGALVSAAQGCPCLEYVDMRGCLGVTDAGCAAIASYCSQLRCWRLSYCAKLTAASLVLLTRNAGRKLEILSMDGMSYGTLTAPVLASAIARGANLRLLSIAGTSNAHHLTDEALAIIVRSSPKLQVLDVSGGRQFSVAALTETIHELKELRRLVVSASGMSRDQINLLRMVRECVEVEDFEPSKAAPVRLFGVKQPPPPPPPAKKPGQTR